MSTHLTDDKLFQSWEACPEPEVGSPDGQTVFENNGVSKYLWHTHNEDEWIHSDTSFEVRR